MCQVPDHRCGQAHVLTLGGLVDRLVVEPAQAMRGDLVPGLEERGAGLRIALQRERNAEYRQRQLAALEFAQDAPYASARSVLVDRLHAHVAGREAFRADDFRKKPLGSGVAVENAVLGAFLVVEDELNRDPCAAGPRGRRGHATVADEIARVIGAERGALCVHAVVRFKVGTGHHLKTPTACQQLRSLPGLRRVPARDRRVVQANAPR